MDRSRAESRGSDKYKFFGRQRQPRTRMGGTHGPLADMEQVRSAQPSTESAKTGGTAKSTVGTDSKGRVVRIKEDHGTPVRGVVS